MKSLLSFLYLRQISPYHVQHAKGLGCALNHAGQRVIHQISWNTQRLCQQLVDAAQERTAAAQRHTAVNDVGAISPSWSRPCAAKGTSSPSPGRKSSSTRAKTARKSLSSASTSKRPTPRRGSSSKPSRAAKTPDRRYHQDHNGNVRLDFEVPTRGTVIRSSVAPAAKGS